MIVKTVMAERAASDAPDHHPFGWEMIPDTKRFTEAAVLQLARDALKGNSIPPTQVDEDIRRLTFCLNMALGLYRSGQEIVIPSNRRAEQVRKAISVLAEFFDERRPRSKHADAKTRKMEVRLRRRFGTFLDAMKKHEFGLDMDAGVLMPELPDWHALADILASAFRLAMQPHGLSLGNSNNGPLARFVAAVIPRITGEEPSVEAVGKHLMRIARKKSKAGRQ
jgi:hypothetical protein